MHVYLIISHDDHVFVKKRASGIFSIGIHSSNSWKLNFVHMYIASPTVIKRPQALRGFPLVAVGGACKGKEQPTTHRRRSRVSGGGILWC